MNPALVVLAAGASRRLGEPKALVEFGGRSALERLLAAGAALGGDPPLVVVGAHEAEIRAAFPADVELLPNPRWSEGRSGGLLLARERRPGRDLCVAPVDTPLVSAATFAALAAAWRAAGCPGLGWLAPRHAGRHGHPIVVGRELAGHLAADRPDRPLRELRALASPLLSLEVPDPGVLDDLDTPADLRRLRGRTESG